MGILGVLDQRVNFKPYRRSFGHGSHMAGAWPLWGLLLRGPKEHINTRISHSGSKAQYEGDARNHVLQDPYVYAVLRPSVQVCCLIAPGNNVQTMEAHRGPYTENSGLIGGPSPPATLIWRSVGFKYV